jgi:hypothetical protein
MVDKSGAVGGQMKKIAAGILAAVLFPIAATGQEAQPAPPAKAAPKKAAQPKAKLPQSARPGQVTVFVPKPASNNAFSQFMRDTGITEALRSEIDVVIDRQKVGQVTQGKPLTVAVPAGPHRLHLESNSALAIRLGYDETAITVSPDKTSYFYIMHNSLRGTQPAELDPVTAKALMDGVEPKASGTATIYIYWPAPLLEIGFLKSDFTFAVDGQRIGAMTSGDYITAKVPAGRHVLTMDGGSLLSLGVSLKVDLILGAGISHYYLITKGKYMEFYQLTAEQVNPDLKSLRQR